MLTSVFGISMKYEAWNHQDSLPVYIAGSYDFHTAYIGNRRCIMLTPTEELATLPALKSKSIFDDSFQRITVLTIVPLFYLLEIQACFSPPIEVGVISQLIYIVNKERCICYARYTRG